MPTLQYQAKHKALWPSLIISHEAACQQYNITAKHKPFWPSLFMRFMPTCPHYNITAKHKPRFTTAASAHTHIHTHTHTYTHKEWLPHLLRIRTPLEASPAAWHKASCRQAHPHTLQPQEVRPWALLALLCRPCRAHCQSRLGPSCHGHQLQHQRRHISLGRGQSQQTCRRHARG
jgi:hypothetical protein